MIEYNWRLENEGKNVYFNIFLMIDDLNNAEICYY